MYITIFLTLIIILVLWAYNKGLKQIIYPDPLDQQFLFRESLSLAKKALDELEIPFFLSSGTCLGYVRDKSFIEYDNDIDIGIEYKNYTLKIIDAMRNNGLYLYRVSGTIQTGLKLSFYIPYTHKIKIDIIVYPDNVFKLQEIDFMGMKLYIPDPVEQYLELKYGKDWRIPKN